MMTERNPSSSHAISLERDRPFKHLTLTERKVLKWMAEGYTNEAIGGTLFLQEKTVENHINTIYHKAGITDDPNYNQRVICVLALMKHTPGFNPGLKSQLDSCTLVSLTPGQKQIINLVGLGLSNIAIAFRRQLSEKTVENAINQLLNERIPLELEAYNPRVTLAYLSQTRHMYDNGLGDTSVGPRTKHERTYVWPGPSHRHSPRRLN